MTNVALKTQIIKWLKEQDYWLQFAGSKILEGETISQKFVTTCYNVFLENYGLKPILEKQPEIIFAVLQEQENLAIVPPKLALISEISNVNALAPGQSIQIGPHLTIVYGANGAGKSGYTRLLNKAFNGRGDKEILKNVFAQNESGEASCKFTFNSLQQIDVKFPEEKDRYEFSCFSIFDTSCVRILLGNDNRLSFTPTGFDFFEKLLLLFEELKKKLNDDISKNTPINNFINLFTNEGTYKEAVIGLSVNSKESELKKLGDYTEADTKSLHELISKKDELIKLDIPKKINELQLLSSQLNKFKESWNHLDSRLNFEAVKNYQELIKSFEIISELAKTEGVKSFEGFNIEQVGSARWREFIKAAKNYALIIEEGKENLIQYPSENDHCLFCLQSLQAGEKKLINAYWVFLKGEATLQLAQILKKLEESEKDLKSLKFEKFDNSNTLFVYIEEINKELAGKWQLLLQEAEVIRKSILKNLADRNWISPVSHLVDNVNQFDSIQAAINNSIELLVIKNPSEEIALLEKQIKLNNDKLLFSKLLDGMLKHVQCYKWAQKAAAALGAFRTNSITTIQKTLFNEHISENYTTLFIEECKKLEAPDFVKIAQKNARGTSSRSLQVQGRWANLILSEGEQKVISLADFFTESQINPVNCGMIFDDPVNSLDHGRKKVIAKRLVELAATKQIIIFTHDLVFVSQLKEFAEPPKIGLLCHWIETLGGVPGQIANNNSPAVEKDYSSTNKAKKSLADAKKASPEQRESILKDGFASLRTNYEYLIIHDLFNRVVLRFEERVSADRLNDVIVTQDITKKIKDKVGLLSRYIEAHLHSNEYVDKKPTPEELEKEISDFDQIKVEVKGLKKVATAS